MVQLENNAFFWQKIDTLVFSLSYVQKRKKGEVHPDHHNLVYPLEYGYLMDDETSHPKVVSKIFKGSLPSKRCDTLIVCCDILSKEVEIKLLLGCTEAEQLSCLEFLNKTSFQKTILVRRSDDMPAWAIEDQ